MGFTRKWRTGRTGEEYPSLGPGRPSRVRGASLPSARGERPPEKGYPAMGNSGSVPRQRGTRSPDNGIIVHRKKAHVRRERGYLSLHKGDIPDLRKEGHATSETGSPCLGKGVLFPAKKVIRHPGNGKTGFGKKGCPTRVNGLSLPRIRAHPSRAKCLPVPRNIGGQSCGMRGPVPL